MYTIIICVTHHIYICILPYKDILLATYIIATCMVWYILDCEHMHYNLYKICLDKFYSYIRYNYLDITPHKFITIYSIVFHIKRLHPSL